MSDHDDIFAFNTDETSENVKTTEKTDTEDSSVDLSRDLEMTQGQKDAVCSVSKELVEWTVTMDGVKHAIVVDFDGSSRAESPGAPDNISGVFSIVLAYSDKLAESLALAAPYGIETHQGDDQKLVALKLKSGFLCAVTDELVNVNDLVNHVKQKPSKGTK